MSIRESDAFWPSGGVSKDKWINFEEEKNDKQMKEEKETKDQKHTLHALVS